MGVRIARLWQDADTGKITWSVDVDRRRWGYIWSHPAGRRRSRYYLRAGKGAHTREFGSLRAAKRAAREMAEVRKSRD